jgi:hypothetical protein
MVRRVARGLTLMDLLLTLAVLALLIYVVRLDWSAPPAAPPPATVAAPAP